VTGLRLGAGLLLALVVLAVVRIGGERVVAQPAPGKVYLTRHAEPGAGADPSLSPAGHMRAAQLAAALRTAGITAIFTSPFARTRETAAPLAAALGIAATPIGVERGIDAHIADTANAVRNHRGGAVLVVGHSNTVPKVIALLGGGSLPDLCEKTHDRLFALERKGARATVTSSRYGERSPPSAADCL
jgi:phosphohistidine phosphatase SixA